MKNGVRICIVLLLSVLFVQCKKEIKQNIVKCEIEKLEKGDKIILALGALGEKLECVDSIVYNGVDTLLLKTIEKDVSASITVVPRGQKFEPEKHWSFYLFLEGYSEREVIIRGRNRATIKESTVLAKYPEIKEIKRAENEVIKWSRQEIRPRYDNLQKQKNPSDSLRKDLMDAFNTYQSLELKEDSLKKDFIKKYSDVAYSANILYFMTDIKTRKRVMEYEELFNQLSERVQKSRMGQTVAKEIETLKVTAFGAVAPDFTITDINGNKISLSDYRGKYVFLEFWATGCGGCLQMLPGLKNMRKQFPKDKMVMLSIACKERSEEYWRKFVKKEQLDWQHALDQDAEVQRMYAISSLPKYFFINPQGKIIEEAAFFQEISKENKNTDNTREEQVR